RILSTFWGNVLMLGSTVQATHQIDPTKGTATRTAPQGLRSSRFRIHGSLDSADDAGLPSSFAHRVGASDLRYCRPIASRYLLRHAPLTRSVTSRPAGLPAHCERFWALPRTSMD